MMASGIGFFLGIWRQLAAFGCHMLPPSARPVHKLSILATCKIMWQHVFHHQFAFNNFFKNCNCNWWLEFNIPLYIFVKMACLDKIGHVWHGVIANTGIVLCASKKVFGLVTSCDVS